MALVGVAGSNRTGDPINLAMVRGDDGLDRRAVAINDPDVLRFASNLTATGTVINATTGRRILLLSLYLSSADAGFVRLVSGTTIGAGRIHFAANQFISLADANGFWLGGSGELFGLELNTITNLGIFGTYKLV